MRRSPRRKAATQKCARLPRASRLDYYMTSGSRQQLRIQKRLRVHRNGHTRRIRDEGVSVRRNSDIPDEPRPRERDASDAYRGATWKLFS